MPVFMVRAAASSRDRLITELIAHLESRAEDKIYEYQRALEALDRHTGRHTLNKLLRAWQDRGMGRRGRGGVHPARSRDDCHRIARARYLAWAEERAKEKR